MAALGFRKKGHPRRYEPPKETTFFRLLSQLDSRALEEALLAWQDQVLGPRDPEDNLLAFDGKKLRASQGVEITSLYAVKSGRWLGSELTESKSNEIPAARALLRRTDLEGCLVVADALPTNAETAQVIVQEKGGDYLLPVKGNQPVLEATLGVLRDNLQNASPPLGRWAAVAQRVALNKGRVEARALERFEVSAEGACFPFVAQAARLTRFIDRKDKTTDEIEQEFLVCSRTATELPLEAMLQADRDYWGIESGLNHRLDVSADEDKSRVRTRASAFNLGLFRRAATSLGIVWIKRQPDPRKATLPGFYDDMSLKNSRKALSLVTASKPSWLPHS